MAYYMEYSTRIYQVYLKYIAPEDIVVYSIDEVFMDVTDYLNTYKPVSYTHLDVYKRQLHSFWLLPLLPHPKAHSTAENTLPSYTHTHSDQSFARLNR